jgi:hypothetical protein
MTRVVECLSGAEQEQEYSVVEISFNYLISPDARKVLTNWGKRSFLWIVVFCGVKEFSSEGRQKYLRLFQFS